MAYDDVIRVADLKTRGEPLRARARENSVGEGHQIVYTTEYMHPRLEEVAGTMPAPLGRLSWSQTRPCSASGVPQRPARALGNDCIWFLMLYALAAFRPIRRSDAAPQARDGAPGKMAIRRGRSHRARTTTSPSRCSTRAGWSRAIPTPMRAAESKFDRIIGAVPLLAPRARRRRLDAAAARRRACSTRTASRSMAR